MPEATTSGPIESPPRVNVLGVGISALSLKNALSQLLKGAAIPGFSGFVTVTGVHGVVESQRDPELLKIHNRSFLSTPDGMPMVWLGRYAGHQGMTRVYGPDLMLDLSEATLENGEGHFYFGGAAGVAESLKSSLKEKFAGLNVVGTQSPPFRVLNTEEELALVAEIQEKKPHFLWVGLSTPKQERFMHGFLKKYPDLSKDWDHGLILLGVGAAFDLCTGRVRQAPKWMQRSGLEWFFRICVEPKRLWRRYASSIFYFLMHIFPQMMGLRKYPMPR